VSLSFLPGFNPVLGFLPASTRGNLTPRPPRDAVSIPFWVFSLLRPQDDDLLVITHPTFQSRSGFSPCFDTIVNIT